MKNRNSSQILDEIVSKMKFKDVDLSAIYNELPQEDKEMLGLSEIITLEVKEFIMNSAYPKSQFLEPTLKVSRIFEIYGIDKEKIKEEPFKSQNYDLFHGIFEVLEVLENSKFYEDCPSKLIEITKEKFPLESDSFDHYWTLSIFLDYSILKRIENFYKGLSPEVKNEFLDIIKKFECDIDNFINSLNDFKEEELKYKKTHTFTGKYSFFKYRLTDEMLEAFKKSIKNTKDNIDEWNNEIFDNFLNVETLKLILDLIEKFKFDDFLDKPLENLSKIFPEDLKSSLSKKAVYLNEVLVIFEHPLGIKEEGKSVYLNKEHLTEDDVRRLIIRNITSKVKGLK